MICVSIGRGRHRHVIAEHQHLVDQGAELVELRLDYIRGAINLKRLLDNRPGPVIVTCRREADGGRFTGTEEERRVLLRSAIAHGGVEYVDLEEDLAARIPRYGKTRRIISLHDFHKTPDDLEAIHARLAALDADIVKLATIANRPHDNLRMLELVARHRHTMPTVGICMGEMGSPSRILAGRFGSPFTYATFHHERALAPGQLSFDQMKDIYHYDDINAETDVYAVIGDPIAHSHSPLIHNAAFHQQKRNKVYVPIRVPREEVASFLEDAPALGIRGLSVTIPHKEAVFQQLTKADDATKTIGATNTVLLDGAARVGYNTDYRAAIGSLEDTYGSVRNVASLVMGAGGAAKAVAHGLKRHGARVSIASRTRERADKLAAELGCNAIDWELRHQLNIEILVNCTPVGMHPNVDESPYEKHYLKPDMVVFDTVYNPENTLLIKDARYRGCVVITGVDMFVRQAALQYQLFTGHDAPADLMRETLKRAIGAVKS
jgi:3-dehydroquinate dehydratase/shikimate dehydrogenase